MSQRLIEILLIALVALILLASQFLLKLGVRGGEISVTKAADVLSLVHRVLTTPALFGGYALSGVAALVWLVVLSRSELSYAFPLLNSIYFVLLLLMSSLILRESVTTWRWIGILTILLGMFALSKDSS